MNDNFNLAIKFAKQELQGFYDRGNSFSALNQKGRSEILGVFSDDFDWQANLRNSAEDFHSFDSVKRYCAHLIRAEKKIPDELKLWIADVLEGIRPTPSRSRGPMETGLENNMLIPRLVEKVAVHFGLMRTRNDESPPLSACDAVHQAIVQTSKATDIKSRQYRTIKQAYLAAKRRGAFMDT
ncbi:hypothetical protein [Pelagovum sp. HNIBRBA483]|uniref:hypothetical protein n=1 Tax=Pelagovum sp. HNIBRBA483 TaxID=3233341 RepID=UPI0034A1D005